MSLRTAIPASSNEGAPLLPERTAISSNSNDPSKRKPSSYSKSKPGSGKEKLLAFLRSFLIISSLLIFFLIIAAIAMDEFVTLRSSMQSSSVGLARQIDMKKFYHKAVKKENFDHKFKISDVYEDMQKEEERTRQKREDQREDPRHCEEAYKKRMREDKKREIGRISDEKRHDVNKMKAKGTSPDQIRKYEDKKSKEMRDKEEEINKRYKVDEEAEEEYEWKLKYDSGLQKPMKEALNEERSRIRSEVQRELNKMEENKTSDDEIRRYKGIKTEELEEISKKLNMMATLPEKIDQMIHTSSSNCDDLKKKQREIMKEKNETRSRGLKETEVIAKMAAKLRDREDEKLRKLEEEMFAFKNRETWAQTCSILMIIAAVLEVIASALAIVSLIQPRLMNKTMLAFIVVSLLALICSAKNKIRAGRYGL